MWREEDKDRINYIYICVRERKHLLNTPQLFDVCKSRFLVCLGFIPYNAF